MLNEQPPDRNDDHQRRAHPLEQSPASPPPSDPNVPSKPRNQILLRIPTVRPTVTQIFLAINIVVFVLRALSVEIDRAFFEFGANNHELVFDDGEFHRLLTSMFLHASVRNPFGGFAMQNSLHLVFNCLIIWSAGRYVEQLFGHARFAIIYLLGGIGGSMLSALLNNPQVFSVGASGAAFAVLGAEFVYVYQHRKLFGPVARARIQNLIWLAVINLVIGLAASASSSGVRIDNWGHIGGAIGGLSLAWAIAPFHIVRRHPEQADALITEDINPLSSKYWAVSLYVAVLLVMVIIGSRSLI